MPSAFTEIGAGFCPGSKFGCHLTAVNEEGRSRNEGSQVGRQENARLRHLDRLAAAPKRNLAKVVAYHLWTGIVPLRKARPNESRANGIHSYLVRTKFIRRGMHKSQKSCLAGIVCG